MPLLPSAACSFGDAQPAGHLRMPKCGVAAACRCHLMAAGLSGASSPWAPTGVYGSRHPARLSGGHTMPCAQPQAALGSCHSPEPAPGQRLWDDGRITSLRTSARLGHHGAEHMGVFLVLWEPREHQDMQRCTGGKPQSSDLPLQTDPSLADRSRHLSLASSNPIKVHGLCRCAHAAHSQLPERICGQQGAGTRSGAGTASGQHPPAKPHKEPLHHAGWDSSKPPALPHKHSPVFPPQAAPRSTHALPTPACTDPTQAQLH